MNKGFTLIELLGVIVVILAISLLAIFGVSSIVSNSKDKLNKVQIQIIEDSTALWITDNMKQKLSCLDSSSESCECVYITLDDLKKEGYIEINNYEILKDISDTTKIKITLEDNFKYSISINPDDISNCVNIYE